MSFAAPNAHRLPAIAALSSFALALSAPCGAQDFYAGKSIQLVIGFDVGGGYDLYATHGGAALDAAHPRQSNFRAAEHAWRRHPHRRQLAL
jgi:tripartite-type tricarboxylate transporter receptor subunit TctC